MKLSEIKLADGSKVYRDGVFNSLGYLNSFSKDTLTCLYDPLYVEALSKNKKISCVITTRELLSNIPEDIGLIVSSSPLETFLFINEYLARRTDFFGSVYKTEIGLNCQIHKNATVSDNSVKIGNRVYIEAGAVIHEKTVIGDDCIIRANCVLSTPGFEFKRIGNDIKPVLHSGGVRLGDRVEIQANSCISRSVFNMQTEIGDDTKMDNLVHIAHNVRIGKRCLIAANAMIAGSVTVGDDVWIGPGAQISSGVEIGRNASITLGSVVTRNVAEFDRVSGNFAINHDKFIQFLKTIR